jgi:regulator of sigma D
LKTKAILIIFNLSLTLHIQARILKFICSKKLNVKNNIEYCSILQDFIKFSQNNIYDIISAKTKNSILKAIARAIKFFCIICFTSFIFSYFFSACNCEKIGNSKANIGQIIINGIAIILK